MLTDMSEEFEDVGLMTGDITINPSATCLVMSAKLDGRVDRSFCDNF